jgi:hypothetical protein
MVPKISSNISGRRNPESYWAIKIEYLIHFAEQNFYSPEGDAIQIGT